MIRYALKCDQNHSFESWFQSAAAYEKVRTAGMVSCPDCGSVAIEKALMAPQIRPGDKAASTPERPLSSEPATDRDKALAELKRQVEEGSDYVGLKFASEARAIHDGTAPDRPIWGEARLDQAKELIDDGILVAPLPFHPKSKTN